MENTLFVSDAEIQAMIQESYLEAYELMIEAGGIERFVSQAVSITTAAGTAAYPIYETGQTAVPVYKAVKCMVLTGGTAKALKPMARSESLAEGVQGIRGVPERYAVTGPTILRASASILTQSVALDPTPDGAYTILFYYIPLPPDLTTSSTQNMLGLFGMTEFIVCDVAAKCLEKEESWQSAQLLMARKMAAAERIRFNTKTLYHDSGGRVIDLDEFADSDWWNIP